MNFTGVQAFLEERAVPKADIGIILGSGLGALAQEVSNPVVVPYKEIPDFPRSTVAGHKGQFVGGRLEGKSVLCMQGRFHYYEGYDLQQVTLPVRVMQKMGVSTLIVTNAAGGINAGFVPGDLMVIEDHINLMGVNPLRGENNEEFGPRFPDMTVAYDLNLREIALTAAAELGINIKKGVYAALSGPSYETPAEIRFLKVIGADAVGMSTVPEVIVANHGGLKVLGISCITNPAAGIAHEKLDHREVMDTAKTTKESFIKLLKKIIAKI
ncbi:MAG: purine-nucleoside phosphorylase [Bacillota bacterium]